MLIFLWACSAQPPEEYTITVGLKPRSDTAVDVGMTDSDDGSASFCETPPNSTDASPLELEGRLDCGEDVYLNRCATCHGIDGEGTSSGQVLSGHIGGHDDAELLFSIQFGEGDMPPQNLQPQDAADVLLYLRTAFNQN